MAGFGGDIRDHKGEIIHNFYGNMGLNSNNSTELEGMVASLMIVDRNNILLVIMEGDSAIPWLPKFSMAHWSPKSPQVGA